MNLSICPKCNHTLLVTDITAHGDAYLVCIHCMTVFYDEPKDPGVTMATFKGKTTKGDTIEYYASQVTFLNAYISQLNTIIHTNISQAIYYW